MNLMPAAPKETLESQVIALGIQYGTLKTAQDDLRGEVRGLAEKMSGQFAGLYTKLDAQNLQHQRDRRTPWGLLLTALGIAVTLCGSLTTGLFFVTRLQAESTMSSLKSSISVLEAGTQALVSSDRVQQDMLTRVSAENAASIKDRDALHSDMARLEADLISTRTEMSALQAQVSHRFTEVETQFRGDSQARNIQYANTLRFLALLWNKTHPGETFPDAIQFYPDISQPPSRQP